MKNIPARIGWELILPIFLIILLPISLDVKNGNWEVILVPCAIFGAILLLMLTIRYKIDDEFLYVKNSIFGTTKIKVNDIYKIEKTGNLISSPAPSIIGRVEIYFTNGSIIISPENFSDFENDLLKINPNITVKK
jgi:hypothetical protein